MCIRIGESVVLQVTTIADIGCFYISAMATWKTLNLATMVWVWVWEAVLLAVWVVV